MDGKKFIDGFEIVEDCAKATSANELPGSMQDGDMHIRCYNVSGAADSIPVPALERKIRALEGKLTQIGDWIKMKQEDAHNKILSLMRCTGIMMDEHDEMQDKISKIEKMQSERIISTIVSVEDSKSQSTSDSDGSYKDNNCPS